MRILLVEDDAALAAGISENLRMEGYHVHVLHDGPAAIHHLGTTKYDMLILDVMLPEMDGFALCRAIRAESDIPILMLTAKGEETDRIVGLELGADDYLTKPFSPREVVARVRGLIRRAAGQASPVLRCGDLALDTRSLWLPPIGSQRVVFAEIEGFSVSLTVMQLVHVGVLLLVIAVGHLLLTRSRLGRQWQAVSEDPLAARLCGVDAGAVFVLSLVAASLIAAIAGLSTTALYGTMDFGAGMMFGLKVVLIAAAGGHSVPWRSAMGAAVVGVAETLWGGYGPLIWRDAVVIAALVAILVVSRRERVIP